MRNTETALKLASLLMHDVAKYISRAARNMGAVAEADADALIEMLSDDLYRTDGSRRASAVFEETARKLEAEIGANIILDRCRDCLSRIDALESSVCQKDAAAIREAVRLAMSVEADLRGLFAALRAGEIP